MNGYLSRDLTYALWEDLCAALIDCSISFSYHEKHVTLTPHGPSSESYAVVVHAGPGRFPARSLQQVIDIAERRGCDVHLLGGNLRILPKLEARP